MDQKQLISVGKNLDLLTKRTRNFQEVLERLQEYHVLAPSEIDNINCCSDDETSISMLYSIVAQKPASNFNLLLYVLQDTDNDELSRFLEESLKHGELQLNLTETVAEDFHEQSQINSILISGGEMGIAELMQDDSNLSSWKVLFSLLNLPNSCLSRYKYTDNFIIQATLILRDWSSHLKKRATVGNLCSILESDGCQQCAGRIRRMFGRYVDSGFGFDFPESGSFSLRGKIRAIASILDNNPSFCFHPERLLLMLNLPLDSLSKFVHETGQGTGARSFTSVAEKMLTLWLEEGTQNALDSTDFLASRLAINGHFHSSNKIAAL